jgi:hypothetical protein
LFAGKEAFMTGNQWLSPLHLRLKIRSGLKNLCVLCCFAALRENLK